MDDELFDFSDVTPISKKDADIELKKYVEDLFSDIDNQSMELIQKKKVFNDLLLRYLRPFHLTLEDDYSLYVPDDFMISDDYDKKIKILEDCLSNSTSIEDSSLYPEIQEGFDGNTNKKGI